MAKRWSDPQEPFDWDKFRALMLSELRKPQRVEPTPISATRFRVRVRQHYCQLLAAALGWRKPP